MVTACDVVSAELRGVDEPKSSLTPYSTCESAGTFVVHAIVTEELATDVVSMPEIVTTVAPPEIPPPEPLSLEATGSTSVSKVLSTVVARLPTSSLERIR